MDTRKPFVPAVAIIALLLVACSGGGDTLSVARVAAPDSTATPVPTEDPTAVVEPITPTPESAPDPDLAGFDITDMEGLMQQVMTSPELMGCLSSSLSLSSLMGPASREPTDAEIEQILPCFSEDQTGSLPGGLTALIGSSDLVPAYKPAET